MQVKLPKEIFKLAWVPKMLKEIQRGEDTLTALKYNKYLEEYILSVESFAGKPFNEVMAEVRSISDPGERLIMATKYFILPLIRDEDFRREAMERVEKIANEIRTIQSPKLMMTRILAAVLGDEEAAEALVAFAESFIPEAEKYINK